MSKIIKPSNDELADLIMKYSVENNTEVLVVAGSDSGDECGIVLDVDTGFIDMFEVRYPGVSIDESLQAFFEKAVEKFTGHLEDSGSQTRD